MKKKYHWLKYKYLILSKKIWIQLKNVLDLSDDLLVFNLQLDDLGLVTPNNHRGWASHHHTLHVLHIWCPKNIGNFYFDSFCFTTMFIRVFKSNLPVLYKFRNTFKVFFTNHSVFYTFTYLNTSARNTCINNWYIILPIGLKSPKNLISLEFD